MSLCLPSLPPSSRLLTAALIASSFCLTTLAGAQQTTGGSHSARPAIAGAIDPGTLIVLKGNVRHDLIPERDLGPVEDSHPLSLNLILKRSSEQQADLDAFIAKQQQPGAPEYHQWITPQQFGERFGLAASDIHKIVLWLQSQGFQVKSVLNNASIVSFAATAGGVRNTFHTQLHYWNFNGGKYPANLQDPSIPASLANVVSGISGLAQIPPRPKHTPIHPVAYDAATHRWHDVDPATGAGSPRAESQKYTDGAGNFNLTPHDFYTIYNANPVFSGGNLGASAVISVPEPTDMQFGTVNPSTGQATGGDVATFRTVFGVPGTLNMVVMHGAGSVSCSAPGINSNEGEATLDAEWANALAPSAKLVYMSCPSFDDAVSALIDNNISDVISSSYGTSESNLTSGNFTYMDTFLSQAATQGQTFVDAAGDAGADDADQNTSGTAVAGFNVDQYAGHPLVLAVGGTDFQDKYDADQGGSPQSTYWGATNSQNYADALGYIPETPWNSSCADSIIAADMTQNAQGTYTGAGYCAVATANVQGSVVGGGGGFSAHYAKPAWQNNLVGLSAGATKRATPDISLFAASGFWGHGLILCDSNSASSNCTSPANFGGAGGTSFTAPQTAGILGLLITKTGERQGFVNPAIYALGRAQFTAAGTASACYSNGQTNNTGVTTGLPAPGCIFHDITTGNNDVPCQAGSTNCFVNSGATYGMLSLNGANSLVVGFPAGPGYDEATGLGSINVANFINSWNQAYSSSTGVSANPSSITAAQSTTLTATITGGTPAGYSGGTPPALTGSVSFTLGMSSLGSCVLSNGSCTKLVPGSALANGSNTITATYSGSGTYPTSSNTTMVTVSGGTTTQPTITFTVPDHHTIDAPFTVSASSNSNGAFTYSVLSGPASIIGNQVTLTGAPGIVLLQATQAADGAYSSGSRQAQFNVIAGSVWAAGSGVAAAFAYDGTLLSGSNGFTGGGWTGPAAGLAFDSLGQAWVAVPADGISLFNKYGTPQTSTSITSAGINQPTAIAIDGLGQVWIANLGNNSISELANNTSALSPSGGSQTGSLSTPTGIAIDLSGSVWVTNSGNSTITKVFGSAAPTLPIASAVTSGKTGTLP